MKFIVVLLFMLIFTQNASSQNSNHVSDSFFLQADSLVELEQYKKAISNLDSAIKYDSENVEYYALKGYCQFHDGNYISAIESFDLALILQDAYAEVYYLRGLAKLELGQEKKACDDFVEAYLLGMKEAFDFIEKICDLEDLKFIE